MQKKIWNNLILRKCGIQLQNKLIKGFFLKKQTNANSSLFGISQLQNYFNHKNI